MKTAGRAGYEREGLLRSHQEIGGRRRDTLLYAVIRESQPGWQVAPQPLEGLIMDMKLEVVPVPVRDVDAAKDFYTEQVGFRLDHDVRPGDGMRVVQMTPPGSACSVVIGEGLPLGEPGSVRGVQLVVEDLDTVRGELAGRGVAISDVQQMGPEGTPGSRYCFFEDPDGNMWAVQEYKRA